MGHRLRLPHWSAMLSARSMPVSHAGGRPQPCWLYRHSPTSCRQTPCARCSLVEDDQLPQKQRVPLGGMGACALAGAGAQQHCKRAASAALHTLARPWQDNRQRKPAIAGGCSLAHHECKGRGAQRVDQQQLPPDAPEVPSKVAGVAHVPAHACTNTRTSLAAAAWQAGRGRLPQGGCVHAPHVPREEEGISGSVAPTAAWAMAWS